MYPRKLLKELADNANKRITEFLSDYREHFPFCRIPILQLYETVMEETFHGEDEKSAIRKLGNLERKKRKKNKQRWFQKLEEAMHDKDLPVSSHPFGATILIYQNCSNREWNLHYNGQSLPSVLKGKLREAKLWADDPKLPLVSYPAILSISQARVYKALKSDIAIDICHTIEEKYNGSINGFWHVWPNKIIDMPLFSPKKEKLDYIPSGTGHLTNRFIFGDGAIFTTSIMADAKPVNSEFSFTEQDMRIMCALFSHIDNMFIINQEITCSLRSLVNMLNPSAGTYYYEKVASRLKAYPCYTYRLEDPKTPAYHSITFNLFDSISIQPDSTGHTRIYAKPASFLAEQIISSQLTFISRKEAECLSLPLSKILMFKIQRERVLASFQECCRGSCTETYIYQYSFFERSARLPYRSKPKNLCAIGEALREMNDHEIFIHSFQQHGNCFHIRFFPLSEEEIDDFHAPPAGNVLPGTAVPAEMPFFPGFTAKMPNIPGL